MALNAAALGLLALFVLGFAVRNAVLQWDFKSCMLAARAALAGLDPYRIESLAEVAGRPVTLPFVYSPAGLLPFTAWAALPPAVTPVAWMSFKVAILAALVIVGARRWAPHAGPLAVALLAVFGWNAAALWDLRAGNVALLEAALLWTGFACFAAGRRAAFAGLVVAAAIFKVAPAAYLLLLLVPAGRRDPSPRGFALALAACAAVLGLPLLVGPAADWRGFLGNVPSAASLGEANPAGLALSAWIVASAGIRGGAADAATLALAAVGGSAIVLAGLPWLRAAWRNRDATAWIVAAVFLDLLLTPRPMAYGFVRLGPAPLILAASLGPGRHLPLLIAFALSIQGLAWSAQHPLSGTLAVFSPYLLTLGLWLLANTRSWRRGDDA